MSASVRVPPVPRSDEPVAPSLPARATRVAVVDDEPIVRRVVAESLRRIGHHVRELADGAAILREPPSSYDVVILDVDLGDVSGLDVLRHLRAEAPDVPVLILSGQATLDVAVQAMRLGAYDYLTKPIDHARLTHSLARALERADLARKVEGLALELDRQRAGQQLIGDSAAMRAVQDQITPILQSDVAVCLLGESGTGKEVVARTIHELGHRRAGPFVAINCAAIPEHLQESELFGHERGAFTGATHAHVGCFGRAQGGTLFLDELGDMSLSTQAKLLRALQEKAIRRVGGSSDVRTDVRVIAATHRDLQAEAAAGRFREDLYFRLMVYPIELPPLRDRKGDIPLLVAHFLKRLRQDVGRVIERVAPDAMEALLAHHWPGNVRELQNAVHRAMLTCGAQDEIRLADLPPHVRRLIAPTPAPAVRTPAPAAVATRGLPTLVLRDLEELAIDEALRQCGGAIPQAARLLGIGRATLYRRILSRPAGGGGEDTTRTPR